MSFSHLGVAVLVQLISQRRVARLNNASSQHHAVRVPNLELADRVSGACEGCEGFCERTGVVVAPCGRDEDISLGRRDSFRRCVTCLSDGTQETRSNDNIQDHARLHVPDPRNFDLRMAHIPIYERRRQSS